MGTRSERIAENLTGGRLPKHKAVTRCDGFGSGQMCDGCGEPILPTQALMALESRKPPLRLHAGCAVIWRQMIATQ